METIKLTDCGIFAVDSDHVIFRFGKKVSKPVLVRKNKSYAWKPGKKQISSIYNADQLAKELSNPLFICCLFKISEKYACC